jgi:tetratricopeptide (TPR) repeat protein
LCQLPPRSSAAAPFEELIWTHRPGRIASTAGEVHYLPAALPPAVARIGQDLDFGHAMRTPDLARAVVRFQDHSSLRIRDRTRLQTNRQPGDTHSPVVTLSKGQFFFNNRGDKRPIPTKTPQLAGVPKGTEFLVSVDEPANRTEFTMFDGEVALTDGQTNVTVRSGQQAIAVTGQGIVLRPVIEATNIVQWWVYYPGILDPAELGLDSDGQIRLAASLAAYRAGDLQAALRQIPGYPTPADPDTDAQRIHHAGLFLAVGAVDRAEAQLSKVNSSAPLARALRTMIAAVAPPLAADARRLTNQKSEVRSQRSELSTASEWLALAYAHQATNNLKSALAAARASVERSTNFGFGWARVAELEFSYGRTRAAHEAVHQALTFTPRNAQAHALRGFLLAAENHVRDALAAFNQAIDLDPALGNAWLGRSLCQRRLGCLPFFTNPLLNRKSQEALSKLGFIGIFRRRA